MNYTEMLVKQVEELKTAERKLAECLAKQTDSDQWLKAHELWLIAQNQLELTANLYLGPGLSCTPEVIIALPPVGTKSTIDLCFFLNNAVKLFQPRRSLAGNFEMTQSF
jgi:hypothetical protein